VSDPELDELRRRKLRELEQQAVREEAHQAQRAEADAQKQAILRAALTPEARERLNRVAMVRPELAANLEAQIVQLAAAGRLASPITDEQLKQVLAQSEQGRRDIKIERR